MVLDAAHEASGADTTMTMPMSAVSEDGLRYRVEVELDDDPDLFFVRDNVAADNRDQAARIACTSVGEYLHSPHYISGFHVLDVPPIAQPRQEDA